VVRIKTSHVLEVVHLTLEQGQVVCQHFPVKLLTNKLLSGVLIILCLSSIVQVIVKLDELGPLLGVDTHVAHILLTNIQEVVSTCEVVKHHDSSDLVEQLLLEVLALVKHLLNNLCLLREHILFGIVVVIPHLVYFLDERWVLHLPLLVILLLEQLELLSIQDFLGFSVLHLRSLSQEVSLLETGSSLFSLVLELRV